MKKIIESPRSITQLSSPFLRSTISSLADLAVVRIEATKLATRTCDIWRITIRDADGVPANPSSVIVKTPSPRRSPEVDRLSAEIEFYKVFSKNFPVKIPNCYYGASSFDLKESLIVLEELPIRQDEMESGVTFRHAALAIKGLATLHAEFQSVESEDLEVGYQSTQDRICSLSKKVRRAWMNHRKYFLDINSRVGRMVDLIWDEIDQPFPEYQDKTLIHGDAHAGNIPMLASNSVVFLDWADYGIGSPGIDIASLISSSLTVRARRDQEELLLQLYYKATKDHIEVSQENVWRQYRFGLLIKVLRTIAVTDNFVGSLESSKRLRMNAERCMLAAVDHEIWNLK